MATVNKPVDVVIVGFGWTGAIMAIELAQTGLSILALERGNDANTVPDWAYPKVVDEIAQSARHGLLQNLSETTVTIRHSKDERAVPYRQIGSFKPGTGVGGAGIHWSGVHVPQPEISPAVSLQQGDPAKGAYVAVLGDCAACHTVPGGKPFSGGLAFPTPVGTIYSGNITPDRQYGIGSYSFTAFVRVMRLGVAPDGRRLYPAMPYTAYAKVSDEDLRDLFAYLQQGVAAVNEAPPANPIPWPLSMRWPLAFWDIAFHDANRFTVDPSKDARWNRGAYLVQGLAHCGTCHTPRGVAFQEVDVSGKTNLYLSGSVLDNVSPINLRANLGDGLGRWSVSDVATSLKSGRSEYSAVTGSMAQVVHDSTQHMAEPDITAIAVYLKSLSPAPDAGHATFAANDATLRTIMAGDERSLGGQIFMDSCSACHRLSGSGQNFAFPTLAGNSSVLSADPSSLIGVILNGARVPSTAVAPSGLAMPPFGWRYDDDEIASLSTFVRSSWGNGAAPVTAAQVAALRKQHTADRPDRRARTNAPVE